jgi:hypothetical protein
VPLLGPSGHGGVGALRTPAPAAQLEVATSQRSRAPRTRSPSSRRSSVEPRKITVKGAPAARHTSVTRDALRAPLTLIFHGSIGAYREDGQGLSMARRLAKVME